MPRPKFSKETGPDIEFARVGRNEASTFTGLCEEHDSEMFRALDTRPLDPADAEQCSLLALRSILRELHVCLEGALRIQSAYLDRVKRGIEPPDRPTLSGIEAVVHMEKAWRIFRFLFRNYYVPLAERGEPALRHEAFSLTPQRPTLATSALFSVAFTHEGDIVGPTLNVAPTDENTTAVILSYAVDQQDTIRAALAALLSSTGDLQKFELSKLILQRVENFALSPTVYNGWSIEKRQRIKDAFKATLFGEAPLEAHEDLTLF